MPHSLGQAYTAVLTVTDTAGNPANCTTVTLTVTYWDAAAAPAAQVTAPVTVVNPPPVTGTYTGSYTFTHTGLHRFDWSATPPGDPYTEYVNVTSYVSAVSLAEARDWLSQPADVYTPKLRAVMMAATLEAEKIVGTIVIRAFTGAWIPGTTRPVLRLPDGPCPSASAVTSVRSVYASGPAWVTADLITNADAGTVYLASQLEFTYGPWLADYLGGRAEPGADITQGVLEIVWDLWATQRGAGHDTDEPGLEEIAAYEAAVPAGYSPPGRALKLLEPHRRPGFA